jgi:hypothetical protein
MPKFSVQYRVNGTMTDIIEADTIEEAQTMAHDRVEAEDWEPDLEEFDVDDVYVQEMHRVVRDGKPIFTTYVRTTDERT